MANTLTKGNLFPEKVVSGMFNKVKGKSSLAKFSDQMPIAFTGNSVFTFSMDKELDVVGEGQAKSNGGLTATPVVVKPMKLEYGARVTDEFLYASEEDKLNLMEAFTDGFSKKLAKAIDIIGMHATNPRGGASLSGVTKIDDSTVITKGSKTASEALEDAVAALGDYDVTGIIVNKVYASQLANSKTNGIKDYPNFEAWGNNASYINGVPVDVNNTVSPDLGIVGDFEAFRWGYAKDVAFEVIEYGNPDNDAEAGDLKGHNQVYLRAEVYVGVAVLDPNAFAVIKA